MDIQDLGLSVWQNRWKTGFVFLLIMSATTAITFSIPKTYRSDGELLARLGRENVMLEPTAMIGHEAAVIIPQSRENEIDSIAEILKSRLLIEKVVDAVTPALLLDLPDGQPATTEQGPLAVGSPRQRAIRLVSQQLRTDPVKRSDAIGVFPTRGKARKWPKPWWPEPGYLCRGIPQTESRTRTPRSFSTSKPGSFTATFSRGRTTSAK